MKKILILLLAAVAAVSTAFAFTACDLFGGNDGSNGSNGAAGDGNTGAGNGDSNGGGGVDGGDSSDKEEHSHSYVWKVENPTETKEGKATGTCSCGDTQIKTFPVLTDGRYIKEKDTATCTEKGKAEYSIRIDGAKYVFNVETPATGIHDYKNGVCASCNAPDPDYVPHTHVYEDKADETGHWTECACSDKTELIPHSYSYAKDGTHHWQVCSVKNETTDKALHNYENGTCVCGAPAPHVHSYTSVKHDAEGHWTECSCGDRTETVPHAYTDGKCSCGAEKPANELDYKLNDGGSAYTVVGIGTVTDKHVIIPSSYNGLPVTEIASRAFANCDMTEVTVPHTVKVMGFSFGGCENLVKVNYTGTESGWAAIKMAGVGVHILQNGSAALYIGGKQVTDIEVDNIEEFGLGYVHSGITSVKIGSGVKKIAGSAFYDCGKLVSAEIADGVEIDLNGSLFWGCRSLESVKLPSGLKVISQWMFESCTSLKQIDLPDGLTHIDNGAFRNSGLTSVNIPQSVKRVGPFAFEYCFGLESVTFEDSVKDNWQLTTYISYYRAGGGVDGGFDINKERIKFSAFGIYDDCAGLGDLFFVDPYKKGGVHFFVVENIYTNERKDYRVSVSSYNNCFIATSEDGTDEIEFTMSFSLVKKGVDDWNACGWSSGGVVSGHQ